MSRVQEIEAQLRQLSLEEPRELRAWLDEFEARQWDALSEADSKAGKLNVPCDLEEIVETSLSEAEGTLLMPMKDGQEFEAFMPNAIRHDVRSSGND